MRRLALPLACLALLSLGDASAHGDGLNKDGCHNNRKTGDYHCHRGSASSAPRQNYAPQRQYQPQQFSPGDSRPSEAYPNCTAARAAGAAPVHPDEPGYGPHLDRDNDGVGCEPYRGR